MTEETKYAPDSTEPSPSSHDKPVAAPAAGGAGSKIPVGVDVACELPDDPNVPGDPVDPFDPETLRMSQDFAANLGVKKALVTVPVRKPDKSWFVRVHPSESYRLQTGMLELKEDRECYIVAPALWPEMASESTFGVRTLFTAINRQGVVFIWQVSLPGPDGRVNEWNRSALEAADRAVKGWIRVQANMSLGAYEIFEATGDLPEPEWPKYSFRDLLAAAFRDKRIDARDHPVLRRLRGEV